MGQTLEQVLADVKKQSEPQRQTILNSIADLPNQQAAEEASLAAKKDQAYTDILDGARRRGTGVAFGGIPLGEQAKYNATEYTPAVARMKTGFNERKGTLESALADIGKTDYSTAYNIFNTDRAFEEQQRQFDAQMREQSASRAATSSDAMKYLEAQQAMQQVQDGGWSHPGTPDDQQNAYNSVAWMLSNKDKAGLQSDFLATMRSAQQGNIMDLYKLQMYRQKRPDLFNPNAKYSWEKNYGF